MSQNKTCNYCNDEAQYYFTWFFGFVSPPEKPERKTYACLHCSELISFGVAIANDSNYGVYSIEDDQEEE